MLAGGAQVSVKIAAGIATVLAVICAAGSSALAAGSRAVSVSRNMVVVTTTADVVNGKTSSIAALNRKPGRDGISLREALLAADNTRGSATVYILFSPRLNGKTIEVLLRAAADPPRPPGAGGDRTKRVAREGHARRTASADEQAGGAVVGSGIRGHRSLASLHRRGPEAQSRHTGCGGAGGARTDRAGVHAQVDRERADRR